MYSIGDFSRINRITTKTLRHYDRIGLFRPAETDGWTGYRYYSAAQLIEISRILELKELGFSLPEIRDIVRGKTDYCTGLERRKRAVEQEMARNGERLAKIGKYLSVLQGKKDMKPKVIIRSLPEVIVASMRTIVPGYNTYFDIVPKMGEYMESVGAVCREPAYCFTIYHDGEYRESDIDAEICEAVIAPCRDSEKVKFKTIPGFKEAACLMHRGPYSTLSGTYNALFTWIHENGREPEDKPRESYIDGIWNREDPEDWLTEVQVPVKTGGSR